MRPVLLIESDGDSFDTIREAVRTRGDLAVSFGRTLQDAIRLCNSVTPLLAICELRLGDGNALDLLRTFERELCTLRATSWADVGMLANIHFLNLYQTLPDGLFDAQSDAGLESGPVSRATRSMKSSPACSAPYAK